MHIYYSWKCKQWKMHQWEVAGHHTEQKEWKRSEWNAFWNEKKKKNKIQFVKYALYVSKERKTMNLARRHAVINGFLCRYQRFADALAAYIFLASWINDSDSFLFYENLTVNGVNSNQPNGLSFFTCDENFYYYAMHSIFHDDHRGS